MDGDSMGKLLQQHNPVIISEALLAFTQNVPGLVAEHDGVTIYAGGDDVLALLPIDTALDCAERLRLEYLKCFQEINKSSFGDEEAKLLNPTISGSIVYAHHQLPLQDVIAKAHHYLDAIAKEQNGRESLAIAVLKSSGVTAEWVSVWKDDNNQVRHLMALTEKMAAGNVYPRGFFHKLQDRYVIATEEEGAKDLEHVIKKLLVAEMMKTAELKLSLAEVEEAVELFINACMKCKNEIPESSTDLVKKQFRTGPVLQLGGGFIARFLTQEEN
jgi:CRISPR-associated protein Cmr2